MAGSSNWLCSGGQYEEAREDKRTGVRFQRALGACKGEEFILREIMSHRGNFKQENNLEKMKITNIYCDQVYAKLCYRL